LETQFEAMAAIPQNPEQTVSEEQAGIEERRALIERVAASEHFSRSARLRDFLLYVGRRSLREGCPEIHEQEIGAQVFGRPSSYDSSQDNIVRVNATELRKRVDTYFATSGVRERLVFEIPRGSYKPVFHWRLPETEAPPAKESLLVVPLPPSPASVTRSRFRSLALVVLAVVCLSLGIACAVLFQENRTMRKVLQPWDGKPALAAFWSGFLDPHRQTDIVLPDDSVSVIEDITGRPITLGDYVNREFLRHIQSSDISTDRKQDVSQLFNHNLVTFGAVRAAQLMLGEIPATYPHYLTLARNFTADEVTRDNVVLIGGKKALPWDHLFDEQINFVTDYDDAHSAAFVRNRNPKSGEQAIYAVPTAPNSLVGYAAIAYLPNPSRTGNVILFAGTDSDASGAAAAFLTSEDQMQKLRTTLHVRRFPYFEVLLKTSRLSGTFFDSQLIAYRTYP
jgi:hypothetical protein